MRKPARPPSFEEYFKANEDAERLATIIRGHLAVEALLIEMIQRREPGDAVYALRFPAKTAKCVEYGFITAGQKVALDALNDMRNDVAHILGHRLTSDQVFAVLEKMGRGDFDFSDDGIWSDRAWFDANYGVDGGIWEILHNAFHDLAFQLHEDGGPAYFG